MIKSTRLRWTGHVVRTKESRSVFKILTGKSTGTRPLGRFRLRWEDIIRMNLREMSIKRRNGSIVLRIGVFGEPFVYGIEPPTSIIHGAT